jgi:hypothetical protein
MSRILASLAALALASFASTADAQTARPEDVLASLRDASREAADRGYRAEPRVFDARSMVGMLPRGGVVVLEATLRERGRYAIVGVCDTDCHDLDLRVHAPVEGEMLDEDVNTDAVPVVTFVAPRDGTYAITVVMSDCRAELCRFAVKVLAR